MTLFDLSVVCIIGISLLLAMMRGFVAEVISLLTWILAFIAAKFAAAPVAAKLLTSIQPFALAKAAGFILVFAAMWVILYLSQSILTKAIEAIGLGKVNSLFGAVFGILRGMIIVTLVVLICAFTDMPKTRDWQVAKSSPFFEKLAGMAVPYLPAYLAERVRYR